ncbi:MAG: 50S ribosomal protein L24 [Ilumatobacteraceae bacterium]
MTKALKLKKGDTVEVITGKDKGKQGEIAFVFPKTNKIIVNGINVASKHQRPLRANEPGGIIDKDMPIDASNVMLVHNGKRVRVGYQVQDDGTKVRVARPSGEVIG